MKKYMSEFQLKRILKQKQIKQKVFATKLGIDPASFCRMLKRGGMPPKYLNKTSKLLKCSLSDLYDEKFLSGKGTEYIKTTSSLSELKAKYPEIEFSGRTGKSAYDLFNSSFLCAREQDVEKLRLFFYGDDRPLIVLGSGGALSVANFIETMYSTTISLAVSMTPLQFNSLSDTAISKSKVLLVSASGSNDDAIKAARKAKKNTDEFLILTSSELSSNQILSSYPKNSFLGYSPYGAGGFISMNGGIVYRTLVLRALFGDEVISEYHFPELYRFDFDFSNIERFIVLYGPLSASAVSTFECNILECGMGEVDRTDYRNFCHGRWNGLDKRHNNTMILAFVTPNDKDLADDVLSFLNRTSVPILRVETDDYTPFGIFDLTIKAQRLTLQIADERIKILGRNVNVIIAKSPKELKPIYHRNLDLILPERPFVKIEDKSYSSDVVIDRSMVQPRTCVGCGRIVLDRILYKEDDQAWKYEGVGGSCGNVISMLSYYGWKTTPIAKLDNSREGFLIKDSLKSHGADVSLITNTDDGGTTIFEIVHKEPKPSKNSYSPGSMYEKLRLLTVEDAKKIIQCISFVPDIFYFDEKSAGNKFLATHFRKYGTRVFFEPSSIDRKADLSYIEVSDIIKFSDENIPNANFANMFRNKLFIQTMGKEGLRFKLDNNEWVSLPPVVNNNCVDAEGAGDWTTATFLNEAYRKECLSINLMSEIKIRECLEKAESIASRSVSYYTPRGIIHKEKLLL